MKAVIIRRNYDRIDGNASDLNVPCSAVVVLDSNDNPVAVSVSLNESSILHTTVGEPDFYSTLDLLNFKYKKIENVIRRKLNETS